MVTFRRLSGDGMKESNNLGILAFEAARTMSRLLSLYKSISDEEIFKLKNEVIKSKGVAFLNSGDEGFLLNLAWAERLEDLDRAANAVSRLGKKCSDFGLNRFDLVYREMKNEIVNLGKLKYGSGSSERRIRKMEKLVETTSSLHEALGDLTEMEVAERRLRSNKQNEMQKSNLEIFYQKLENQRREVRYLREISLWGKSFDKSVDLMAKIVCVLYVRICSVFGPQREIPPSNVKIFPHSGPLLSQSKPVLVRFYSRKSPLFSENDAVQISKSNSVFHSAGPSTVAGSGLAMRYANIILLAEKYLDSTISVSNDERESFYEMLPENLKSAVRAKLSRNMKYAESDACLAAGWRDAVAEMMEWVAPVADDTVKWQMERSFEKMKFDAKPSALLLQTLHFSDKEKTEAAIVEILVGLSCIFRFENRPLGV
ncbi:hypothetical protein ACS0TY_016263 [Phlomoides rotata]